MAQTEDKAKKREAILATLARGEKVSIGQKVEAGYPLTWQEKLRVGKPLSPLEDTKAEADFAVKRHLREQRERAEFEARKATGRAGYAPAPPADEAEPEAPVVDETNTQEEGE